MVICFVQLFIMGDCYSQCTKTNQSLNKDDFRQKITQNHINPTSTPRKDNQFIQKPSDLNITAHPTLEQLKIDPPVNEPLIGLRDSNTKRLTLTYSRSRSSCSSSQSCEANRQSHQSEMGATDSQIVRKLQEENRNSLQTPLIIPTVSYFVNEGGMKNMEGINFHLKNEELYITNTNNPQRPIQQVIPVNTAKLDSVERTYLVHQNKEESAVVINTKLNTRNDGHLQIEQSAIVIQTRPMCP